MRLSLKLSRINWLMILLILIITGVGIAMLYSAAGMNIQPWAFRQSIRFAVGFMMMMVIAFIPLHLWWRLSFPIYLGSLGLLIAVEIMGEIGMGAQRWIDLKFIRLQPSELMKVALVMAVAAWFHHLSPNDIKRPVNYLIPLGLILIPAALVLRQPDLGTALMLIAVGGALFFLAGVPIKWFIMVGAAGLSAMPLAWHFLRDYQKGRIKTFLDPERDPTGAGYHVIQSKIALGSGGLWGKGFGQGTQSHLNFLPEKQTDFIFTMLAEEMGLVGACALLALYAALIALGIRLALKCENMFARLMVLGLMVNLFLYVFINTAMVMGLLPVVGVPLPLVSYGGTVMLTTLIGMGLIISASIYRDKRLR